MKCLCGLNFCWHCLRPFQKCEDDGCIQEEEVEGDDNNYSDGGGENESVQAGAEDDSDATIDAVPTQTPSQPSVQRLDAMEDSPVLAVTNVSTKITFTSGRVLTIV